MSKRLDKFQFDFLDILMKYYPKMVSATEMVFELRERGHDITKKEFLKIVGENKYE